MAHNLLRLIDQGTIVRDGKRLLYFYARFTNGHDVGASSIVCKVSEDDGDSWSPPLPQITPSDGKGRANPGASVRICSLISNKLRIH